MEESAQTPLQDREPFPATPEMVQNSSSPTTDSSSRLYGFTPGEKVWVLTKNTQLSPLYVARATIFHSNPLWVRYSNDLSWENVENPKRIIPDSGEEVAPPIWNVAPFKVSFPTLLPYEIQSALAQPLLEQIAPKDRAPPPQLYRYHSQVSSDDEGTRLKRRCRKQLDSHPSSSSSSSSILPPPNFNAPPMEMEKGKAPSGKGKAPHAASPLRLSSSPHAFSSSSSSSSSFSSSSSSSSTASSPPLNLPSDDEQSDSESNDSDSEESSTSSEETSTTSSDDDCDTNDKGEVENSSTPMPDTPFPRYQPSKWDPKEKWGKGPKTLAEISKVAQKAAETIPYWRRNLFEVPSGATGKRIAQIMTDLLQKWTLKSGWELIALDLFTIFPPLILQRSGKKVAAKEAKLTIARRLQKWDDGEITELLEEGIFLQNRLPKTSHSGPNHTAKVFSNLILQGKVKAALRLLSQADQMGVAQPSPEVLHKLQEKHPPAVPPLPEALLPGLFHPVPSSLFDSLNGPLIQQTALASNGSAGPFGLDASDVRTLLCSKSLGTKSSELSEALANMARRLCTEFVDPQPLRTFLSCRLIPLEKGGGDIRPIGIGETFRRIVGKAVTKLLKPEIQKACGNLQECAGIEGGCEAAIHAMRDILQEDENEAALLIDASNAFNSANRGATLHNISILCPSFFPFLVNTYRIPLRLFVPAWKKEIASTEGTTQGDPAAMPMYALSVIPLIRQGQPFFQKGGQVWYADDATAASKLHNLKNWWQFLAENGPKFGYFPKASKTILVVKPQHLEQAKVIFKDTGISIDNGGTRHLGGALGTDDFMQAYVRRKVQKLVEELSVLVKIAETQPQAAYAAFTHGFQSKWTFIQRVIPETSTLYLPIEEKLKQDFLPKITGQTYITEIERDVLALPARLGGLGVRNPIKTANESHEASRKITLSLVNKIKKQEMDDEGDEYEDSKIDESDDADNSQKKIKRRIAAEKRAKEKNERNEILLKLQQQGTETDEQQQHRKRKKKRPPDVLTRALETAAQKGTSSWLTSMPNRAHELNKQEWKDSMALRYGWQPKNLPQRCSCSSQNSVQHALDCKLGGFIHMRHNRLRDLFADLLKKAGCKAVDIERQLLPDEGELQDAPKRTEKGDEARMDVTAVGFWSAWQRAFFDVRVFNPLAPSYASQKIESLLKRHENEKKGKYGIRIREIDHGTFTPLVFTTSGGCGKECDLALKRLGNLISEKTGDHQSAVMNWVRTEINFCLLRSCHICLRGTRNHKAERAARFADTHIDFEIAEREMRLR